MWHRVNMWAITLAVDQQRLKWVADPHGDRQLLRNVRTGTLYDYKLVRKSSATPTDRSGWFLRRRPPEILELELLAA